MNKNKNCQDYQGQFPDYLTGDLNAKAVESIQNHVTTCPDCRSELEELTSTWTQLGILPEEQPGANLRMNFYTMLESFQEGLESSPSKKFFNFLKIKNIGEKLWPRRPVFQLAAVIVFLIMGLTIGYFMQLHDQNSREIARLRQENRLFRQQLTVSLLNQSSPSQRLKGLMWSRQLENPADETLETLLHTLNYDPNVNVRLTAVDALYLFSDHPKVKQGLMQSLQKQTSPMVQIALIDLLVEMREKKAIKSLKQLLERNKLNPEVKERAQLSLKLL
ncbi:MAG: HEAT repeat domain-containing protein [Candidatus Aminicenantes bacterium]|jgi:hypothetical protein